MLMRTMAQEYGPQHIRVNSINPAEYVTGHTLYVDGGMTLYPGFSTLARNLRLSREHGTC